MLGVQLTEQRYSLFQIERAEAFSEPAIDGSQHGITLAAPPLFAQQYRQACRGAQFKRLGLLPRRNADCLAIQSLSCSSVVVRAA